MPKSQFVSRAGQKLEYALSTFDLKVTGWTCADLGANAGGFTDSLLQRHAAKVYAIDTGYGALEWKLRKDPRVVVMERTNAMHAVLPEAMDLVVIDVAWTRQRNILPAAHKLLKPLGQIITLIKPQYEAQPSLLVNGVLPSEALAGVVELVKHDIADTGLVITRTIQSPIQGTKGNSEFLALLKMSVQH